MEDQLPGENSDQTNRINRILIVLVIVLLIVVIVLATLLFWVVSSPGARMVSRDNTGVSGDDQVPDPANELLDSVGAFETVSDGVDTPMRPELPSVSVEAPEYYVNSPVVFNHVPPGIFSQMRESGSELVSIKHTQINDDKYLDIFVTMGTAYPSEVYFVFLWNEDEERYVDVTPPNGLSHNYSRSRFNRGEQAFCFEHQGSSPHIDEYISNVYIYHLNGFQEMTKTEVPDEELVEYDEDNLYCDRGGWQTLYSI